MIMRKLLLISLLFTGLLQARSSNLPDEGMWLPMFVERLNYVDMQKMGLKLTPKEIYDINNSSLKDAIVNLGGFCTAEVVSPQGLLFTNHHCGYDAIQSHSSIDHDYLTDGFWANSYEEELPNEGLSVSFLVKMDDVTDAVLKNVNPEMNESERSAAISKAIESLKQEMSEGGKYEVSVKGFYNGNEYYRFVYQVYNDIRLVGAPPSAIGKFGGDTDNWMWPRHTGDFSIFRIYSAPDGSPAEYSKDNVPFKPKHFLKISAAGVKPNDFTMIWGYPGTTDRYRTSDGIRVTLEEINPAIIKVAGTILDEMKKDMDASDEIRIKYASHYAQLANFWKNKIGESRGLKRLNVYEKKKEIEKHFMSWVNADPQRQEKYGSALQDMANVYDQLSSSGYNSKLWYFQMAFFGSQVLPFPLENQGIINVLKAKLNDNEQRAALQPMLEAAKDHFKDYNAATEKKILIAILETYREDLGSSTLPDFYNVIAQKFKGSVEKYVDYVFNNSFMVSEDKFNKFMQNPSLKKFENDPAYKLTNSFYSYLMTMAMSAGPAQERMNMAKRLFVDGLRKANPGKVYYPDANSTLRMSYGQVLDYYPADAVHYDYVTYADGILEKEDPTNDEFIVPKKLKELIIAKDFGRWQDKEGRLPICFISNNDITGGNSGSPVLNGNGDLIGLAFDGNWEAMSGDIAFEPDLQRTINVDIRYVMFVIDKYAGCKHILNELQFAETN
jgi:uncharacterized protein YeaO (DUF488 family)